MTEDTHSAAGVDHIEFGVHMTDTNEAIAVFVVGTKGQSGTPDDRKALAGTLVQTFPDTVDPKLHGRSIDLSDIGNPTQSFEKPADLDQLEERVTAELRAAYPDTNVVATRAS